MYSKIQVLFCCFSQCSLLDSTPFCGYSLVLISSTKMIAARDPYGFRPLCYGKMADGAYVVASESCALSAVGAEFIRDVLPGEILVFTKNGVESRREHCEKQKKRTCIFVSDGFRITGCMENCSR